MSFDHVYNVFGSGDSLDCDFMVFVDSIPAIEDSKRLCAEYEKQLGEHLESSQEMNANLAVVRDGVIVDCFKGTPDEVNNSILTTYLKHNQEQLVFLYQYCFYYIN